MKKGEVKDIKPLNLDSVLGQPRNRVARVGIEIEGGWDIQPKGYAIQRDGSVFKEAGDANRDLSRTKLPGFAFGEVTSGPIMAAQVPKFLKACYPKMIDDSCGLHIHMGLETLYQYNLLTDSPVYQETVVHYLTDWARREGLDPKHPIWPRLEGKSEYCQKKFWPEEQMQAVRKEYDHSKYGHRYTMIHYCWTRFQTVECRLLPMMETPDLATRALNTIINVTNAYLMLADKQRVITKAKINMPDGSVKIKMELRKGEVYEEYEEA